MSDPHESTGAAESSAVPNLAVGQATEQSPLEASASSLTEFSKSAFHDQTFESMQHDHDRSAAGDSQEQDGATEIRRIASRLSQQPSSVINPGGAAGDYNPAMDPDRPEFDIHSWLRYFIQQTRELGFTESKTGVAFRQLDVFGSGAAVQVQKTVGSLLMAPFRVGESVTLGKKKPKHILRGFNGLIKSGELLVVLGRPGSGCSTLLKSLCGELHGLDLGDQSIIHYGGVPQKQMQKEFRGEAIYNQELDKHFPHLTVGQTLEFAASFRTPAHRIKDMPRSEYCRYLAKVVMAILGLQHTYNTKVGDSFVRGVSGGERKRVSIAEMVLAGSPFGAWDNSTCGLDSASAFTFVEALRKSCDLGSLANAVAIYQASQSIYDLFDKATVLYEGRQIYFGPASLAKDYFERQGWHCPMRQTTGDFLTSVTNPMERRAREGMEAKVPRTSEEFERYWRESPEFKTLIQELDVYDSQVCGEHQQQSVSDLRQQKNFRQAKHVRPKSPYTISVWMQIRLNCKRAYQRTWNDLSATVAATSIQVIMALIIGSSFYQTPDTTEGFYSKGSTLFVAALLNALIAMLEIVSLYSQRPIVEKHASYAFYHPFTEAAAGLVSIIPIKIVTAAVFNAALYFLAGLRREPGAFFLYFLVTYVATFAMTAVFRTLAAMTKTVAQAMALSGVMVLALVMYTGFVIPVPEMHPWFGWIRWINPIYYAFEILVANEFHDREFPCASRDIVPAYQPLVGDSWICGVTGAVAGRSAVSGDAFIAQNYHYSYSHVWRNFGILVTFMIVFIAIYLLATELNSTSHTDAESLVFRRGHVPRHLLHGEHGQPALTDGSTPGKTIDVESDDNTLRPDSREIEPQRDIFVWRNVVYDIQIKKQESRLLDHVDGWVKPGTLTALMGVSGAGKTTLLDVLAMRTTMGVISGDMLVNGKPRDPSFQRKTGYVQQQDLHVDTATVRESLRFSAMLRQPASVSREDKYAFVEKVIKMLNMEEFSNAVVGVPGQGLNVEQRKLLTIGVELAAKPKLLLFLDEPTSGLDSQSSWAIVSFLRKLADSGQAILCTVHQPSGILFEQFDRLLFLAKGGKTVYFGDIGHNSATLLGYFESNGARKCGDKENPAEYMIEVVNEGTNERGNDWHSVWRDSPEFQATQVELDKIAAQEHHAVQKSAHREEWEESKVVSAAEFAMPLTTQIKEVTHRVFLQYWRMPQYIIAKFMLGAASGLFIGFTFYKADATLAGMQNIIYSVFMVTTIFSTVVQQIQPHFVAQRELYEVRERPSKAYSWIAFLLANMVVEIPFQIITSVLIYLTFYLPVAGVHQGSLRQGFVFLLVMQLMIYGSAFAHMTIVVMPDVETAGSIVTLFTVLSILFSGVLQTPAQLPGFWRNFVYRVTPFNYWISAIVSTALHDRPVSCSPRETSVFDPPANRTCGEYLAPYLQLAPGHLLNPADASGCQYCTFTVADQFVAGSQIFWSEKWRNYGIVWAFIAFDLVVAVLLYYLFRVKQWRK